MAGASSSTPARSASSQITSVNGSDAINPMAKQPDEEPGPGHGQQVSIQSSFVAGVLDALSIHNVAIFVLTSNNVRSKMLRCALLNLMLFCGSILFTNWVLFPISIKILGDISAGGFIVTVMQRTYQILWVYPVYGLSFLFNSLWYQNIADSAFIVHGYKPAKRPTNLSQWVSSMADEIYRIVFLGSFFVLITVLSIIPFFGRYIWMLMLTWLYSFYMWEYRWALQGWTIERRIVFFQRRWPYFFGFGFPACLLTVIWPNFVSYGVLAFLFPCFIILAITSRPVAAVSESPEGLPIFKASQFITEKVLQFQFSVNKPKTVHTD